MCVYAMQQGGVVSHLRIHRNPDWDKELSKMKSSQYSIISSSKPEEV